MEKLISAADFSVEHFDHDSSPSLGALRWAYELFRFEARISLQGTLFAIGEDGMIVATAYGGTDNRLVGLQDAPDADHPERQWTHDGIGAVSRSVVAVDAKGRIYACSMGGTDAGRLQAILHVLRVDQAKTARELWQEALFDPETPRAQPNISAITVSGDIVYYAHNVIGGYRVLARHADTGESLWRHEARGFAGRPCLGPDGVLYVPVEAGGNGAIIGLEADTGKPVAVDDATNHVYYHRLSFDHEGRMFATERRYQEGTAVGGSAVHVFLRDAASGHYKKSHRIELGDTGQHIETTLIAGASATLYGVSGHETIVSGRVAQATSMVWAIDARDAKILWARPVSGRIAGSPTLGADGTLYLSVLANAASVDDRSVATCQAQVHALHARSGAPRWIARLPDVDFDQAARGRYPGLTAPVLDGDGTVLVGISAIKEAKQGDVQRGCYLLALRGDEPLARTAWPIENGNAGHTGTAPRQD
ncbi:hypothetical protein ACPRNU_24285 [Chromobacterium vaccinii]|uniref:hypothetical protein n=1 Tax=Chromobacterium vaccinii TaxID=1108595 RepID=UPI003C740124